MKPYNHREIEPKWQHYWYSNQLFEAKDFSSKPKFYGLIEFPYPSGTGMHVGHIRAFSSLEVISRKRRMEGYNVLFPMGFDAFGLPTENFAIKTGIHPRIVTNQNIKTFITQLQQAGFSFDYSRILDTTQPEYYKWTQWIFLQLFKQGLAYKSKTYVNFCPSCKVVLANEESQGGRCDRCDTPVVQLEKDVWFLKITAYADSLLQELPSLDYLQRIKIEQENWIGKSQGAEVHFGIEGTSEELKVFTTRPDTLFGVTFMVIAPEHPLLHILESQIKNKKNIEEYQELARHKSEFERVQMNKTKTGVRVEGILAVHPFTKQPIPIFVSDYVMMGYGTGAIMAVPGHDERDYEFAKKYGLQIKEVIAGGDLSKEAFTSTDNGILVNSEFLNGLPVQDAIKKAISVLQDQAMGHQMIQFKMKDWAFNRQRYWGEPIPIINCPHCGQVAVPEEELPVILPEVEHFEPGANGESPLASMEEWVKVKCPKCGGEARRETDTMPQWAGSSWYFLRYCDPRNDDVLADKKKLNYWMPVDWYNGGMEHVTRHMIYSRFWNQFLFDQNVVTTKEPYKKRTAQGLILGPDGEKMSKSKGNVVDPLAIIHEFGADTLRLYILFIGEYDQPTPWNENGVKGCSRFLEKVWRFQEKVKAGDSYSPTLINIIHKTIKEVSEDIEAMKFNTAISKMMILSNEYVKQEQLTMADLVVFLKLLNPFAPHICEELYAEIGHHEDMVHVSWPTYDPTLAVASEIEVAVQVNGKLRGTFIIAKDADGKDMEAAAKEVESVIPHLFGKNIVKVITIPNKIVNFVVKG